MSPDALRRTALHDLHVELGARMIDFAGWSMPIWYGGATDEHHAVRTSAGLFDLGHMAEIMVTGVDAGAGLDRALLVDASAMPIGRARYTMMCAVDGGIIDDLIVYRLDADDFMVVANASNGAAVLEELIGRIGDAATVTDRTDDLSLVALQGPHSVEVLSQVLDDPIADLGYYRIGESRFRTRPILAARTGYTGEDGFEMFVEHDLAGDLWRTCAAAGVERGVVPAGLAARDTLRLEAGMPLYGNELTRETTPFDVGSARLVRPKVADYVGRAALERAADQPHRWLIGLDVEGRRPARSGYAVLADDRPVGVVTSGALSPTLGRPIAMAIVDLALEAGDRVTLDIRGTDTVADVTPLPFYSRPT